MNWQNIQTKYPLAVEALKQWYASQLQEAFNEKLSADVHPQYGVYAKINGRPAYCTKSELYGFFDDRKMALYIIPAGVWPKCAYFIQTPKAKAETESVYEDRIGAEEAGFETCFKYLNAALVNKQQKIQK